MKQTVYIDILFIINQFINYFLLLTCAKLSKVCFMRVRLFLAASLGGAYSLVILLPEMPLAGDIAARSAACVLIIIIAFKIEGLKHFFKLLAVFFGINFAFAGVMLALWLMFRPNSMIYKNGSVYFDINLTYLAIMTIICYAVIILISKLAERRISPAHLYELTIYMNGKSVCANAIFDTGNSLVDAFTGYPVIIAQLDFVRPLLSENFIACVEKGNLTDFDGGTRLIPYRSVGGEGLLPAFRPDKVRLKSISFDKAAEKVYIAVCRQKLKQGEYSALLSNALELSQGDTKIKIRRGVQND